LPPAFKIVHTGGNSAKEEIFEKKELLVKASVLPCNL